MVRRNFYPRPPRGGRPLFRPPLPSSFHFYPRPPRGGRQELEAMNDAVKAISIHALREEGDFCTSHAIIRMTYFYPRPPRGGRLRHWHPKRVLIRFLSTPSARRATHFFSPPSNEKPYFYPRPPRGGRRLALAWHCAFFLISIHALREEGDAKNV